MCLRIKKLIYPQVSRYAGALVRWYIISSDTFSKKVESKTKEKSINAAALSATPDCKKPFCVSAPDMLVQLCIKVQTIRSGKGQSW